MCVRVLVLVGSRVCECTCGYACSWARVYVCVRADAPSGEMRMRRMWCASAQVGKSICEWEIKGCAYYAWGKVSGCRLWNADT